MSSDPPRLKDMDHAEVVANPARALLRRACRVPAMTSDDRAAILGAIGAATAGGAAGGAGVAKSLSGITAAKTPLVLAVGGVLVVGATVLAVLHWQRAAPSAAEIATPSTHVVMPPSAPLPVPLSVPLGVEEPAPIPSQPLAEQRLPAAPSAKPPRAGASRPSTNEPSTNEPSADTLGAESALIARARAAIEANPREALSLLEDHARRFPRGELAAERDFLRIKSLGRVGRTDEARQRARAYATKYPSSPYVPAVRTILGELGEP